MSKPPKTAPSDEAKADEPPKRRRVAKEVLDELLKDYRSPEDLTGPDGLLKELVGALVSRAMDAELTHHLGYEAGETPPAEQPNRRNGKGSKKLRTGHGEVEIDVPRDRDGTFEPKIVPKHKRDFDGFDDKIIAMYGRGMSVRDIQSTLAEIYGVDVSPDLISRATEKVLEEMRAWQQRALEPVYLVVYVDALVVKIRDKGTVQNKAVYSAIGIGADGHKEVLGLWIQQTEGAKFWLAIFEELRQRGVEDVLVLCADGLTGMSQAVEAVFPKAIFQTCIVHLVRSSTRFVPYKDRRKVCADLRAVYNAPDEPQALEALRSFEATWGARFPMIVPAWRRNWDAVAPFLAFPAEVRRAIYTTNAIEALHRQLRKVLKTRGHLPNDDAALKILFLAIRNASQDWVGPARSYWSGRNRNWNQFLLQFVIHFGDRIPS
jgi:putative transposase